MRQSADWYKKSPYNDPVSDFPPLLLLLLVTAPLIAMEKLNLYLRQYDIGMCAYNSLLRVVARFHDEIFSDPDSPSGLNEVTGTLSPYMRRLCVDPARVSILTSLRLQPGTTRISAGSTRSGWLDLPTMRT